MPITLTSGDLHLTWKKPVSGSAVVSYTVQARKGSGAWIDLVTGIAAVGSDPQRADVARALLVSKLPVVVGDSIEVRVLAVNPDGKGESPVTATKVPW